MGYWGRRGPTALGVVAKKINGVTVGYVLGWVTDGEFSHSVRQNLMFNSKEDALKMLENIEANTAEENSTNFEIIAEGKHRYPDTGAHYRKDRLENWLEKDSRY